MNTSKTTATTQLIVIGLVACSMLIHEILLTRICALRLQFHFAFLVISNCLLGLGAAGTLLSLKSDMFRTASDRWLTRVCGGYVMSLLVTYVVLVRFPLPSYLLTLEPAHVLALSVFNLVGALPLFFSGLVIGLLLTAGVDQVNRLYAVDLLAAAVGCFACPALLPLVGAGGAFVASLTLALVAWTCMWWRRGGRGARGAAIGAVALSLLALPQMDQWLPVPARDATLHRAGTHSRSTWTSNSRIDLLTGPGCASPLMMRGKHKSNVEPRECAEIAQDATAATTIVNFSDEPAALDLLRESMYVASYRLRTKARVLVIGLGGGNDVWAAKAMGASTVRAIELNWPIVDIHKRTLRRFSRGLIEDPSVELVVDEGRSAIMHDRNKYSIIQMTGIDTWTALVSGAYVLAENYLYTREAISSMYDHLEPGGILQIARFAQTVETLRLVSTIQSALASTGTPNIERSIIALSTPDLMTAFMIKKGTFSSEEQASTAQFAEQQGFEILYLPDRPRAGWENDFIRSPDRRKTIDDFPLNISPVDDDQPYFFNFWRWRNPLRTLETVEVPPGISQGNPAFILGHLFASIVFSSLLIVYPLVRSQEFPRRVARPFLGYFAALGAGFIAIELAIMQKLTLFLGQPIYSLTVTLFGLLLFTGCGSLLFAARFSPTSRRIVWIPVSIALYVGLLNVGIQLLVNAFIGAHILFRIFLTLALLAPLGVLLGIPFAYGLRVAEAVDRRIIPWAWAVNGCMSVVGSVATVVISMNFGFTAVLWMACLLYPAGFIALHRSWTMAPRTGVAASS